MRPFYYYEMEILEVDKAAAEASSFVVHLYIIMLGWAQRRALTLRGVNTPIMIRI
jgi:hypothetical protein